MQIETMSNPKMTGIGIFCDMLAYSFVFPKSKIATYKEYLKAEISGNLKNTKVIRLIFLNNIR